MTDRLKLFLITQRVATGYDTYDSAVVAAESAEKARETHPSSYAGIVPRRPWDGYDWASSPDLVVAKLIGEAAPGIEPGVIIASFNAG